MRTRTTIAALAMSALLLSSTAFAQQGHVLAPSQMRQAVADQAVTDQQNRDAVLGVLHNSQVADVAARLGLNVTSAVNAVATLNSADLARAGDTARQADTQLAGGNDRIVISTTTLLILVLLVLLLTR